MGELVHQGQSGPALQDRDDVQLLEAAAPVSDRAGRKHFEIAKLGGGRRPPVPLPVRHHRVGARASPCASIPQHGVSLPHPRGNPQVGAQPAAVGTRLHRVMCRSLNGEIRPVPKLGRGAIGHHWIRSDMHTSSGGAAGAA